MFVYFQTFHNISNLVFKVEAPSHFENIKLENKSTKEQNKNISKLHNGVGLIIFLIQLSLVKLIIKMFINFIITLFSIL